MNASFPSPNPFLRLFGANFGYFEVMVVELKVVLAHHEAHIDVGMKSAEDTGCDGCVVCGA
jgi:hypothetical protein